MTTVAATDVRPGDRLVVREADVLPVDGVVVDSNTLGDEPSLTGEAFVTREAATA